MSKAIHRTATLSDVALLLEWAADEGWNPGQDDAEAFYASDPDGFFVAEVADQIVAGISVVNHTASYAFLGLYLCKPEHRGQGIGYDLWQHALTHAGNRTIGLDGVPDQEANYTKSGFVRVGRTRRLTGVLPKSETKPSYITPLDHPGIARLDNAATGVMRERFLSAWLRESNTRKTVVLRDAFGLVGFATARRCKNGVKVGPIVAPDALMGLELARHAATALGAETVIIDVPDSSAVFGGLLREHGFAEGFATARMFRGPAVFNGNTLQAVATLELG